jgi:hypothetical protein
VCHNKDLSFDCHCSCPFVGACVLTLPSSSCVVVHFSTSSHATSSCTATSFSFYHFHHVPTLSAAAVIITFATNCQTRLKGLLDSRMMWSSAPSSCIKTTHRWCYIDGIPVYFTCAVWRGDCDYDTQAALGLRQVVSHMIDLSKAKSTATIFGQSEYVAPSYRTGLEQNLATELTSTCINRS